MRDGYTSVERRVTITPSEPTSTLTLNLARSNANAPPTRPPPPESVTPRTADVFFESRPTGASVFLDGKPVGTTPMALPSVRVGSHCRWQNDESEREASEQQNRAECRDELSQDGGRPDKQRH